MARSGKEPNCLLSPSSPPDRVRHVDLPRSDSGDAGLRGSSHHRASLCSLESGAHGIFSPKTSPPSRACIRLLTGCGSLVDFIIKP